MTQSVQATPTLQANIAGASTTVNLRDWLNTRLSPFLKKAIIESLDSEAEYPLQWLGEHLIQQSILFEGNPDSTNIQERFRYKHDAQPPAILVQNAGPSQAQASAVQQNAPAPTPTPQSNLPVNNAPSATPEPQNVPTQATGAADVVISSNTPDAASSSTPTPAVNVNGDTETQETSAAVVQDTEMSNAP